MPDVRRALKDISAGAIFIVIGGAFALGALAYDIGTPLRMGPGYVPLVLGGLLIAFGAMVIAKGFIAGEEGEPTGAFDVRAAILLTAALIFFGVTIRGLGVIGAIFGASLLAALARSATSILEAVLIAVALTAVSVLIFVVALQLRLPLIGDWIPL